MVLQPVDLRDDVGLRPLIVGIVSIILATVAVVLRLYSHRITRIRLLADDWLIIAALVNISSES